MLIVIGSFLDDCDEVALCFHNFGTNYNKQIELFGTNVTPKTDI